MGEIFLTLHLEPSKVRKMQAKAVQKHKNKKAYTRKNKHKARESQQGAYPPMPGTSRALLFKYCQNVA